MNKRIASLFVFSVLVLCLVGVFASEAVSAQSSPSSSRLSSVESKIGSDLNQRYASNGGAETEVMIWLIGKNGQQIARNDYGVYKSAVERKLPKGKIVTYMEDLVLIRADRATLLSLLQDSQLQRADVPLVGQISLQDSVQILNATGAWSQNINSVSVDGGLQTVCVIDTGVDFTHQDLSAKNIYGVNVDCSDGLSCVPNGGITDLNGHGTNVAGIVAASGQINGIAKGANLISMKVFPGSNSTSGNYLFALRRAVDWCVANSVQYNISVISISSGTSATFSSVCNPSSSLVTSIANAVAKNISVVASTGNGGSATNITAPACIANVIPVGAVKKDSSLATYSNYNSLVKLFAIGSSVNSTCISSQGTYCTYTGTSQATPMVSGTIAIANQVLKAKGEKMTPKQIETLLYNNGNPVIGLSGNYSIIDVYGALIAMDSLAPNLEITAPSPGTIFNSNLVTLSHIVNDEISGLASCSYKLNNDPAQGVVCGQDVALTSMEGNNSVTITATDSAGNSIQETVAFVVDTTGPQVVITSPTNDEQFTDSQVSVNYQASDSSGLASCSYKLNNNDFVSVTCNSQIDIVAQQGENTLTVSSTDILGNANQASVDFSVDSIIPEVSIISPADGDLFSTGQITISHAESDSSGLASCSYGLNGEVPTSVSCNSPFEVFAQEGSNNLVVQTIDNFGNTNQASVDFNVDTISPSVEITSPLEDSVFNEGQVEVSFSVSDENSGLASCSYDLNDNGEVPTACGENFLLNRVEGSNVLSVTAKDLAGNEHTQVVSFVVDTTGPQVEIISPANGAYVSVSEVEVVNSVSDSGSGLASCYYVLNGGEQNLVTCNQPFNIEALDGDNMLSLYAQDNAGNEQSAQVSFMLDRNSPELQIVSPAEGYLTNDPSVDVDYEAFDHDSGLQSCSYSLNSASFVETECNAQISLQAEEGLNELMIMVSDNAGNEQSATVGFAVDTTAPEITITSPTSGVHNSLSQVLQYSVDDENAGCSYVLNGEDPVEVACGEDVSFEAQEGENVISVIAVDMLGNQNEESVTFSVSILSQVLGDLNGDGLVNEADLAILLEQWGQCPAEGECPADFNDDGVVDGKDLKLLLYTYWTEYCLGDELSDCQELPSQALD